jgi:hypothetical protein
VDEFFSVLSESISLISFVRNLKKIFREISAEKVLFSTGISDTVPRRFWLQAGSNTDR